MTGAYFVLQCEAVNTSLCIMNAVQIITLLFTLYTVSRAKIPLHIRSLISYDSYETSIKFADIQSNAADHVNRLPGLLDDYELTFGWDWALVSNM